MRAIDHRKKGALKNEKRWVGSLDAHVQIAEDILTSVHTHHNKSDHSNVGIRQSDHVRVDTFTTSTSAFVE